MCVSLCFSNENWCSTSVVLLLDIIGVKLVNLTLS